MTSPKKYNCLIVDDEPPAREIIQRYVKQVPMLQSVGECGNAVQALALLNEKQVDLLFLDIQMPQISGIQLIKALKHVPKIIFTTAFEHYAVQAFELDVTDYLVKPIAFERFLKAVMKALPDQGVAPNPTVAAETSPQNFLYFRSDRKMVKVFLNEIMYVESLKDYIKIQTTKGTVIAKHSMTALEAMLPTQGFMRVHRSFLIAADKIQSFTSDEINIQGQLIPIGKFYRQQTLKLLSDD